VLVPQPGVESTLYAVSAEGGWLRTSPELALKTAMATGLPRLYEIGPCLRAEEHGPWHRREFTMLEWYRAGATLADLMDEVEALVAASARAVGCQAPTAWRRVRVRDLCREVLGIDPYTTDAATLSPDDPGDWDAAFFRRWVADVEPTLTGPTFVTHWPASQSAAARVLAHPDGPATARFEAYLGGVELANAFLELTDAAEQRRRLARTAGEQAGDDRPVGPVDGRFVHAVGRMPPAAGIALGVERLVAVLMGWDGIGPGRVDG